MAIPISKYIDIKSKVLQSSVSGRDFSGLVFTAATISDSADDDVKEAYNAGEVISLTADGVSEYFTDATLTTFASNYFGYNGGNSTPATLNIVKILSTDTTALIAYNRVIKTFTNFGAFTFLGSYKLDTTGAGGLLDVATANDSTENVFVVVDVSTNASADSTALSGLKMTHLLIAASATDKATAAWMPMAWYASVDYDKTGASDTIDYKQFGGANVTVDSGATKDLYDGYKANYIGLVQINGQNLSFYQTGINMNGTDLGVIRDETWVNGAIAAGWFNLTADNKVPANYTGAAMVKAMVLDVASQAVDNGVILVDKELSDTQISTIYEYTQNDDAASQVQSTGYYIDTKIVQSGTQYVCQYTLVYAKGDHISKVTGMNYLV